MKYVTRLVCRQCGASYPVAPQAACDACFGPLEVSYDYDAIRSETSHAGPRSIWR